MKLKFPRLIKSLLAFALLCGLIWISNPTSLLEALSEVSAFEMAFLMLLSFLMIGVSALKWQMFIGASGGQVSLLKLFRFYLVGYFVNTFLPSYIGGDVYRSYYIGKSVGQHQAFSATLLERYTGLLAMSLLGMLIALIETELISFQIRMIVICLGLVVISLTAAILVLPVDFKFGLAGLKPGNSGADKLSWLEKVFSHLSRLKQVIFSFKSDYALWIKTLTLSLLYHFLTVANTYFAAVAIGWDNPPIFGIFIVLPIILIIGAIPITPSGLGIQEGAFFHFLQILGASAPQALGIAVVLRAKTYLLAAIGWLFWIRNPVGDTVAGDTEN